ncbi:MAG TPA: hypothetical protein VED45_12765 [Steroidobacteraceae bacterium]|nr:hypothetical protein [Steroidobacteraceae bacterium]
MAADPAREIKERRPAVWPWLVMPLIILLVFCALRSVHQRPGEAAAAGQPPAAVPEPAVAADSDTARR